MSSSGKAPNTRVYLSGRLKGGGLSHRQPLDLTELSKNPADTHEPGRTGY